MAKFRPERATDAADLPHRFEEQAQDSQCQLCLTGAADPRHVSWEREQLASRERAQAEGFQRETGS